MGLACFWVVILVRCFEVFIIYNIEIRINVKVGARSDVDFEYEISSIALG